MAELELAFAYLPLIVLLACLLLGTIAVFAKRTDISAPLAAFALAMSLDVPVRIVATRLGWFGDLIGDEAALALVSSLYLLVGILLAMWNEWLPRRFCRIWRTRFDSRHIAYIRAGLLALAAYYLVLGVLAFLSLIL